MDRDIPAGFDTTASVDSEDFARGVLERRGDHDWYRIELDAGSYVLRLSGSGDDPVGDPLLVLRDERGNTVERNDDSHFAESRIELEVTGGSETYFLDVSGKGPYTVPRNSDGVAGRKVGHATGDFTLSVNRLDGSPVDAIAGAQWVEERVIDVYFMPDGARGDVLDGGRTIASAGWAPYQVRKAMAALDAFSDVCGVSFRETSRVANADFRLFTYDKPTDYAGLFQPPGTIGEGNGVFNYWAIQPRGALERGAYGWELMLHEFGHGLGLAHPHDPGFGTVLMEGVRPSTRDRDHSDDPGDFGLNSTHSTVMSYRNGDDAAWFDRGFVAGTMAFDIAALQQKYGASRSHHGDDSYTLATRNEAGTGYLCLWDTGGEDTVRAGRTDRDVTINLNAATLAYEPGGGGFLSSARGIQGGLTIANGVELENAAGADGDDRLVGNDLGNRLSGGAGADWFRGGPAADRLAAGDDNARDLFVYRTPSESGASGAEADRIIGFDARNGRREAVWDRIDFRDLDGDPGTRGDQPLRFVREFSAPDPADTPGQVRAERLGDDMHVLVDLDGDGAVDIRLILLETTRTTAHDFLL